MYKDDITKKELVLIYLFIFVSILSHIYLYCKFKILSEDKLEHGLIN